MSNNSTDDYIAEFDLNQICPWSPASKIREEVWGSWPP